MIPEIIVCYAICVGVPLIGIIATILFGKE